MCVPAIVCVCVVCVCVCVLCKPSRCTFPHGFLYAQNLTLCSERGGNVFSDYPSSPAAVSLMSLAHKINGK